MKYNIFDYNQKKAVELGLDLKDLLILNWIQTFYPKMHKTIRDGKQYFWVKYSAVLQDVPILEIDSEKGLYKRMKKMCEIGILEYLPIRTAGGCFSYYLITEMMVDLVSSHSPQSYPEKPESYSQSPQSSDAIINSSTINSSTIYSKEKTNKKENSVVKENLTAESVNIKEHELKTQDDVRHFVENYDNGIFDDLETNLITEYILKRKEAYKSKVKNTKQALTGLLNNIIATRKQFPLEWIFEIENGCYKRTATSGDATKPFQTIKPEYYKKQQNKINLSNSYEYTTQAKGRNIHTSSNIYYGTNPQYIGSVSADDFKVKKPSTDESKD